VKTHPSALKHAFPSNKQNEVQLSETYDYEGPTSLTSHCHGPDSLRNDLLIGLAKWIPTVQESPEKFLRNPQNV
jgi:two-component sensor histidine kinase